jgi:hypothetical protein
MIPGVRQNFGKIFLNTKYTKVTKGKMAQNRQEFFLGVLPWHRPPRSPRSGTEREGRCVPFVFGLFKKLTHTPALWVGVKILGRKPFAANPTNFRELALEIRAIREIRGKDFRAPQKTDAHPMIPPEMELQDSCVKIQPCSSRSSPSCPKSFPPILNPVFFNAPANAD